MMTRDLLQANGRDSESRPRWHDDGLVVTDEDKVNACYVSLLLNHHRMTYQELKHIAALSDSDLSSALGWLLCEGELFVSTEDGREYLELRMDYDF